MAGMASAFFLYGASALVAPWWAVVLLLVVWAALLLVACAWWTPRPRWVPGVAVFAVVLWFAAITAGAVFLDWSA
jgi:hypothetical protein